MITQLKETISSQLYSESDRLQFAVESAQLGFWDWDIQTGDLFWSE